MYSKIALSIGGSDSGGGAGIQADLRTFMALKVHGCSVITCITAQNSLEVTCVEPVEKNTLLSQLDTLFADFGIDALKTGMLLNERIINYSDKSFENLANSLENLIESNNETYDINQAKYLYKTAMELELDFFNAYSDF